MIPDNPGGKNLCGGTGVDRRASGCPIGSGLFWMLFLAIMALGAFLRMHQLGKAFLWIDEIGVLVPANSQRSVWEVISSIYEARFTGFTGQHMPFHYALLNVFLHLRPWTGSPADTWWVRLPFVLLGIGTLPFVFWAVSKIYDTRAGLWSMFLVSISFFHIYMSRDATSYSPLLFFTSASFAGLASFLDEGASRRARYLAGALFTVGSFGALFSHVIAWFSLALLGLLLLVAQGWMSFGSAAIRGGEARFLKGRFFQAAVLLVVSTLPVLPLMIAGRETFFASEEAVGAMSECVTFSLLIYQLAIFGWGRSSGRLTAFVLVVVVGIIAVLMRRGHARRAGLAQLALLLIPAAVFLSVQSRDFAPRYLSIVFFPLVCFAGLGAASLAEAASKAIPRRGYAATACIIVVALLLSHAGPYKELFAMTDKRHAVSPVYEWILENVPVKGLYVMRNSYYMRDVPQTYPVGDRYTCVSDYPQYRMPTEVYQWRSRNVRGFFERFPLAVLIVEPDSEYEEEHWPWIHTDFSHTDICSVYDNHLALWKYGFWQHGYERPEPFDFHVCYNTEEDVLARAAARGRDVVAIPVFGGWGFFQTREGTLFTSPVENATLRLCNLLDTKADVRLRLKGAAAARGVLFVDSSDGKGRRRIPFGPGDNLDLDAGLFILNPGGQQVVMHVVSGTVPSLLIHEFKTVREEGVSE